MDTLVKTLIDGLKSTSSSVVQETLLELRSKVIANDKGIKLFTECKGLTCLVPHLRKPNERILDLTLSILGNCCLDEDCRTALRNLNIVPSLVTVLKTVCRDSIVGRACRVIGNLALNTSSSEDLHNHGVVPALVALIENRDKHTTYPTLAMAVRATRQLWMVTSKREEMLSVNSVLCISILFIAECESAGILSPDYSHHKPLEIKQSQEELISGILKSFVYFTTHVTVKCAEQVNGDGRGYQCLIALSTHSTFGSPALRCLMNLCFLATCRPILGNAGLVSSLIGILKELPDACLWPEGVARMLFQLSGESVNRARIRQLEGMSLLIVAAREHTFALRALLQYIFDDVSFQILVKEGLMSLVVDELKRHLTKMKYEHNYKNPDETPKESNWDSTKNDVVSKKEISPFKRCLPTNKEDELNVVIERDNMIIGFSDTVNSDGSDSQNEAVAPKRKRARARSTSPSTFLKRTREWGTGLYWEMKQSTSRSPVSPEPAPMSPSCDGVPVVLPEYRATFNRGRSEWSPESGFSTEEGSCSVSPFWPEYQWSPSTTGMPYVTMLSSYDDSSNSETSGSYSPVCSDSDAGVAEGNRTSRTQLGRMRKSVDRIQITLDDLAMNDSDINDSDAAPDNMDAYSETDNLHSSRIACVLVLLARLSNGSYESEGDRWIGRELVGPINLIDLLAGRDFLNTLLDYVERCRTPRGRVERILNLIFGNSFGLIHILKHKIIFRLYNMTLTSKHPLIECKQCRLLKKLGAKLMVVLSNVAEASHGVGEISYQLLRGSESMKATLSVTLPYIVKSKPILKKFYTDCGAFTTLFAEIPETTEDFEYFVTALGKLATSVKVVNPKMIEHVSKDEHYASYNISEGKRPQDEIVVFKLEDLSTVTANKTFLCKNSAVFAAMLEGCFKERTEKVVNIKNATKPGLEYLFTLLHRGYDNANNDRGYQLKVVPVAEKLEHNLEALLLADRFLFHRLKNYLRSAILNILMKPDTVVKIYVWSLNEGMGFLCVEAVAYLLTGSMRESERAQAFKDIMSLKYKEQWLDDVKTILLRHLDGY